MRAHSRKFTCSAGRSTPAAPSVFQTTCVVERVSFPLNFVGVWVTLQFSRSTDYTHIQDPNPRFQPKTGMSGSFLSKNGHRLKPRKNAIGQLHTMLRTYLFFDGTRPSVQLDFFSTLCTNLQPFLRYHEPIRGYILRSPYYAPHTKAIT